MNTREIITSIALLISACMIGIMLGYNLGKNTVYEKIINLEQTEK